MQFPLVYFEQNLVFNQDREVWALYRLQPWHYDHLSDAARLGLLWRLSRLFWDLEDCAGQLLMVPRSGHDYYLALRLPKTEMPTDGPGFVKSLWQEPRRLIEEAMGLRSPQLLDYELIAYSQREEAIFGRLSRIAEATRLEPQEIAGLIQRGFWRGIADPPVRPGWAPDALVSPEGEMDLRNPRRIRMTQLTAEGEQSGLTSFCYVADLPDELTFPGSEWLYGLEELPFPVEVCLRWSSMGEEKALPIVRRKRLAIVAQDEQRRFPPALASICFAVSAPDERKLQDRVQQLRSHMRTFRIGVEVPAGDQLQAFLDSVPGAPAKMADYVHRVPPEVLAGSMFLGIPTPAAVHGGEPV